MTKFLALALGFTLSLNASALPSSLKGENLSQGKTATIDLEHAKRPTVVMFLSSRCPCSRSHEAAFSDLAREHKGVDFVGIHSNVDELLPQARKHFKDEAKLPFPVVQDDNAAYAKAFGADKTPHVFVVAKGEVVYKGGASDAHKIADAKTFHLKNVIEDLEAGRKPRIAEAKALGCYIKMK